MLLHVTLNCDNNGDGHFEQLTSWELSDVDDQVHAKDTLVDLISELRKQAAQHGWLIQPPEHDGWTRVLCDKCCAEQGGQDG